MKLLFDQNLSPKLVNWLADLYPGSSHVLSLGLDRASDEAIWEYARDHGYAIVTKDADLMLGDVQHVHPAFHEVLQVVHPAVRTSSLPL